MTTRWQTEKDCKCGNRMMMEYSEGPDPHEREITVLNVSGQFRCRFGQWPNYVYCIGCDLAHDLTTFKKRGGE